MWIQAFQIHLFDAILLQIPFHCKVIETVQYQNDGDKGKEKAECNVNVAKLYIGMWLYYV